MRITVRLGLLLVAVLPHSQCQNMTVRATDSNASRKKRCVHACFVRRASEHAKGRKDEPIILNTCQSCRRAHGSGAHAPASGSSRCM